MISATKGCYLLRLD